MLASSSVPVTPPPGSRNGLPIFLSAPSSRFWQRTDNLIPSSKSRIDSSRFVSPDSSFATTFSRLFRASSKVCSFPFAGMLPPSNDSLYWLRRETVNAMEGKKGATGRSAPPRPGRRRGGGVPTPPPPPPPPAGALPALGDGEIL